MCLTDIFINLFNTESNTWLVCCGVWKLHEWIGDKVIDNCYDHNYHQINNLTKPFIQDMEVSCHHFPKHSFYCKLLFVFPIFFLLLLFIIIVLLSTCAIVTCVRLKRLQRYNDSKYKSQTLDSCDTNETPDEPNAPASPEEKKKPIDV